MMIFEDTEDKKNEIEGEAVETEQEDLEPSDTENAEDFESISKVFEDKNEQSTQSIPLSEDDSIRSKANSFESITNSDTVYHERLPMLEIVFDRLVRLMTGTLRNFTGDNVEVLLDTLISVRFGDYLNSVSQPSIVNIFTVEEWDNQGIVVIDTDLVYSMIDILLGGSMGVAPMRLDNRYFTSIELNLLEKLLHLFLGDLNAAFDPLCPITLAFDRMEMNPKFATITRSTNIAILVRISIQMMQNRGGTIELLIPYATMEPIRDLLLQKFMGEKFGRDTIWETHLVDELIHTDFNISAILDKVFVDLKSVLNWEVGSQIILDAKPDSPIQLVCGDHPLFTGKIGRKSGNIAVKIEDIIQSTDKISE